MLVACQPPQVKSARVTDALLNYETIKWVEVEMVLYFSRSSHSCLLSFCRAVPALWAVVPPSDPFALLGRSRAAVPWLLHGHVSVRLCAESPCAAPDLQVFHS